MQPSKCFQFHEGPGVFAAFGSSAGQVMSGQKFWQLEQTGHAIQHEMVIWLSHTQRFDILATIPYPPRGPLCEHHLVAAAGLAPHDPGWGPIQMGKDHDDGNEEGGNHQ